MKPVLVGMNNPLSADPCFALYPSPRGCSGHRLWLMLREVSGASRRDYAEGFERRNLVVGKWSAAAAKAAALHFTSPPAGATIVVLGAQAARALGLDPVPIDSQIRDGVHWRMVPHPSGRNRWYNDETNRLVVGLLLEELLGD